MPAQSEIQLLVRFFRLPHFHPHVPVNRVHRNPPTHTKSICVSQNQEFDGLMAHATDPPTQGTSCIRGQLLFVTSLLSEPPTREPCRLLKWKSSNHHCAKLPGR